MRIDQNLSKKETLVKNRKKIFDKQQDNKHKKFLSFGEFDRIAFEKVDQFNRFRDLSENTKGWIGDRQIHLIYSICEDNYPDEIFVSDGEFYERNGVKAVLTNRLFIGLTVLQFKNEQKENSKNMEQFLLKCKLDILNLIGCEESLDIKCAVFGTLGSFGLTIIWLAEQYTDILRMVTKIKNTYPIFLSAYTIFAQNHTNGTDWDQKVSMIKGNTILRLTLKNGVDAETIHMLNSWKEPDSGIYHCAGEHDVVIRMKSSKVFTIFDKGEALYYDSEFFKKHVLQSNVQFCETLSETAELEKPPEKENAAEESTPNIQEDLAELNSIQEEYKQLRFKFADLFPSTAGMVDTLDLLYGDYISKISTASNEMWADNFSHQFFKVLRCLTEFISKFQELQMPKEDALLIIDELLGDFEWQISHIAQSNNLILGTPVCQFRYSGQNNLTLYAYFGIIKSVLKYVYSTQEISMQDEIVPLIVADIVPIIQSTLYFDYAESNELDSKIVTINLPMVSLYNPVCYYPYLYHEVFHYVVPIDRYSRNRMFGHLISIEILYAFFAAVLRKTMKNSHFTEPLIDNFLRTVLLKYIYAACLKDYDGYIGSAVEKLDEEELTCDEMSKITSTAYNFEHNLLLKWVQWFQAEDAVNLENNPVYLCICSIYGKKEEIQKEINSWEKENPDHQQLIKSAMTELFRKFGGVADNNVLDVANKDYQELVSAVFEDDFNHASMLISSMKEALADIAMVKLGNMDFAEYLLLFTKVKKDLLLEDFDKGIVEQDMIRTGIILDLLHNEKSDALLEAADAARDKYINMYCGIYYSSHRENEEKYFHSLLEDARNWFHYWKKCVCGFLSRYAIYSIFFRELQKGHLVSDRNKKTLDEYTKANAVYWTEYAKILQSFGDYMNHNDTTAEPEKWEEKKRSVHERIFSLNIQLIHYYQYQDSFMELDKLRTDTIDNIRTQKYKKEISCFEYAEPVSGHDKILTSMPKHQHWQYHIKDIGTFSIYAADLSERLKESTRRVLGREEYPIWYRGQESTDYKLVPSIMRKYPEERKKSKKPEDFSLLGFLRKKFEEFRFRSDDSQESIDRVGYTDSDYIALMQHHSVASNFLDWTEEVPKALYFALEGFLDKKTAKTNTDAALYLFSPALYNHARIKMIQHQFKKDPHMLEIDKQTAKETLQEGIPNLSVSYNADKYDMYLLGCDKFQKENTVPYGSEKMTLEKRAFYLPVAVYASRLNKRIQAQSGVFLAYNIYTCPDQNYMFDYMSLEEIQKDYLTAFQNEQDTCPFLYKIVIEKTQRQKLASWVSACGMSKEKCYPELVNIGERVMR